LTKSPLYFRNPNPNSEIAMRLIGHPGGTRAQLRAALMTMPFDRAFAAPVAALPERTFAAPPRGTTFCAPRRGINFSAPARGTYFEFCSATPLWPVS
jgi:hypothetical protein